MEEEVIKKDWLLELVTELEQKVEDNSITPDDLKKALYQIREAKYRIQELLDLLQDSNEDMKKLYRSIANENYADLIDGLNSLGYRYRKQNKDIKDAFEKMGYRIMEQTRVGKRDDVFYSFLRIYMSVGVSFDRKLLLAFKHPNDEMFKVLIFSFLSGIIEEKTNNQE